MSTWKRRDGESVTIAFSNAERVMMSRGRIFFSKRLRMTEPTLAHSCIFSGDSAGYEDDPGRVMPKTSAALAIVFAVYIYAEAPVSSQDRRRRRTYPSAGTGTGARMAHGLVPLLLGCFRSTVL